RLLSGLSWPVALRRLLGLFAFAYAGLHFTVWLVLDHFFDWPEMGRDILKRPYITIGMLALATLVPLAATSTAGMIRRLGGPAGAVGAHRRRERVVPPPGAPTARGQPTKPRIPSTSGPGRSSGMKWPQSGIGQPSTRTQRARHTESMSSACMAPADPPHRTSV